MLDAIEGWVNQGRGSPALAAYLRRAGVTHLVVRNDLSRTSDNTDPVLVHQALANSPGLVRETWFGPAVGGEAHLLGGVLGRVVINGGWQDRYPAIEVYRVEGGFASARASERTPVVVGGPEDLLDLQDLRVLGEDPTVLAIDADADRPLPPDTPLVLTDGLRAVERNFGKLHDGTSPVRAPDDPRRLGNPTGDYVIDGWQRWQTHAEIDGVAGDLGLVVAVGRHDSGDRAARQPAVRGHGRRAEHGVAVAARLRRRHRGGRSTSTVPGPSVSCRSPRARIRPRGSRSTPSTG